jgi:hypothetical protein
MRHIRSLRVVNCDAGCGDVGEEWGREWAAWCCARAGCEGRVWGRFGRVVVCTRWD